MPSVHPFIPVPKVASVEMIYLCHGSIVENQFHTSYASNYTLSTLQALRAIVDNWHNTVYKDYVSSECVLTRIRTKAQHVADGDMEDYALPTPRPGAYGAIAYPNNVTFAFKKSTFVSGRSNRGRWYLVGIPAIFYSAENRDEMRSDLVAGYKTRLDGLISALASGGHTMEVVSYRHNKAWRTTGHTTLVNEFVPVNNQFDSQRRRLVGRGI